MLNASAAVRFASQVGSEQSALPAPSTSSGTIQEVKAFRDRFSFIKIRVICL